MGLGISCTVEVPQGKRKQFSGAVDFLSLLLNHVFSAQCLSIALPTQHTSVGWALVTASEWYPQFWEHQAASTSKARFSSAMPRITNLASSKPGMSKAPRAQA